MTTPAFTPAQIRRYYDRNTAAFVRLGQGADVGAIHRAVWGPQVTGREEAFRYVEDRIADLIASLPPGSHPPHIVDLGCGVGASLSYLAGQLPVTGTGVTLSPVQARVASVRIAAAGLADRVVCLEGDYCALPPQMLPPSVAPADLAYAIESFVHGPSPERFFAEAARVLRPGGLLVVCDDMRRSSIEPAAARAAAQAAGKAIARFERGWHVNSLLTAEALRGVAAAAGFSHESTTDLTPYLELRRARDRAIAALVMLTAWLPMRITRLEPLVGGSALQTCLVRGWIGYDFTVFRRTTG